MCSNLKDSGSGSSNLTPGTTFIISSPHRFSLKLITTNLLILDIFFDRTDYRLHIIILHVRRKPNSIIYSILFIQSVKLM